MECLVDLGVGRVKCFFGEWPLFIILHPKSCDYDPFLFRLAYMWTKVKVGMSTWLRSRDSKVFLLRMTTFYNPASEVIGLHSIFCSDLLTCGLKLRLECLLDLGVGTVKSFFEEWPLFIILCPESWDFIPFPVQIGILVNYS